MTTAMAALFGTGGASKFNLFMGAERHEEARKTLGNSLLLLAASGALIGITGVVFLRPMLYAFGSTDAILPYAEPYALIISIGVPFGIFATGASYFIRADGSPNYSSAVLLSGAIFNIIFDPVFLFAFGLGVKGIALATTLAQILSSVLALYYFLRKFKGVTLQKKDFLPGLKTVQGICALGSATFFTHLSGTVVQIVKSNMLRHYGALSIYGSEISIAAAGAVVKVSTVLMSCVIGISLGCQPLLGYNYGAKKYDRVKETYKLAIRYTTVIAIIAFFAMEIFPRQILGIFGSKNPLFYEFAVRYMRIFLFMTFANALQPVTSTFFTSIGKAYIGFFMSLIRQVLLLIPLMLLLPLLLGIAGLFWAGPLSDCITVVVVILLAAREMRGLSRLQAAQNAGSAKQG
jgi:putative MATE family efflux protein